VNLRFVLPAVLAVALLLGFAFLIAGCSSDPRDNISGGHAQQENAQTTSSLDLAMAAVAGMPVSKDSESPAKALFHLNQWIGEVGDPAKRFEKDPILSNTPRSYVDTPPVLEIDRRNFESHDLFYLQQCLWFRDIANRVTPRPAPPELAPWFKTLEKQIGISEAERLRSAERLFDWTICSIQLDKLPPPPKAASVGVGSADLASRPAPLRGEVGPGYWQLPWQVLLYGHGDSWQRSRLFVLLCRQAGITAHMLGVQDESGSGAIKPWACGVLIKGELYLFDARLGLPILGSDGGIATLAQVVADPALIRAMDYPGEPPYPVTDAELKGINVLLDAEPQALSLRMQLLESVLIGNKRVVLTCRATDEEIEVRKCKHISGVSLWRISLEAVLFQMIQELMRQQNKALQAAHLRDTYMFFPPQGLAEARHLQFEGHFYEQKEEGKPGACQVYDRLRMPNSAIESLETSSEARQLLGMKEEQLNKDPKLRAQQIKDLAGIAQTTKNHATYWISLCHFDAGDFPTAEEWLRDRTIQGTPDSPWLPAASYNLARCYEAQGRWEEARELYQADESPQRAGNLLRAQRIAGKK